MTLLESNHKSKMGQFFVTFWEYTNFDIYWKQYLIFVFLTRLFLVSLLITTLHNRWMSGAMIAVSRCLYVVKSDIFDKIFARFNGKLLATGIWVISILYIIPVFLEVHTYRLYLFRISYSSINYLLNPKKPDYYLFCIYSTLFIKRPVLLNDLV